MSNTATTGIKIVVTADTARALSNMQQLFGNTTAGLKNLMAGAAALVGVGGLGYIFANAIKGGVRFNATLQDATLGIAAIQKQFSPEKFKSFDEAMRSASTAVDLLREKAVKSPASFQQLVSAFQGLSGAATSAGISMRNQVNLVVLMSQALAGLGIRSEQILQESRALLTGNINENAMAARILGITKEDIDQAKKAGQLYEFLSGKLAAFSEAGQRGAGNFTTALSNLHDVLEQKLARATETLFKLLSEGLLKLTAWLDSSDIAAKIDEFVQWTQKSEALRLSIQGLATALAALAAQRAILGGTSLLAAFIGAGAIGNVRDFVAAVQLIPLAASAAVAALAPLALAIAAIAGAGAIAFSARSAGRAKLDEQQSAGRMAAGLDAVKKTVDNYIVARFQAGQMDHDQAWRTMHDLNAVRIAWLNGSASVDDYRRALAKVVAELKEVKLAEAEALQQDADRAAADREMRGRWRLRDSATTQSTASLFAASLALEEMELKASYDAGQVSLQSYFDRRKEIVERGLTIERGVFEKELKANREEYADNLKQLEAGPDPERGKQLRDEQNKLIIDGILLTDKLSALDIERLKRLSEINTERRSETASIETTLQRLAERRNAEQAEMRSAEEGKIRGNWRLTTGEKIDAIRGAGGEVDIPDPRDWADQWDVALTSIQERFQNLAATITGEFAAGVHSALDQMATVSARILDGTKTLAQGWLEVGQTAVRSIVTMVGQYIAGQAAMFAADSILHTKRVGQAVRENAVNAAGGVAKAGAQGGIPGVLIYAGVYAAVMAAVTGLTAAVAGYREGGYTGDGGVNDVAGVVHRGEFVVPASAVSRLGVGTLEAMTSGTPMVSRGRSGGSGSASEAAQNVPNIHIYMDKERWLRAVKEDIESISLNAVLNRRSELGMQT